MNRMMKEEPDTARIGISGADTRTIKVYFQQKSVHQLNILERVVIIAGGNDLCRRAGGNRQVPNQPVETVRARLEELVRFVQAWAPHAVVVTTDLIPRESEGGFFNARARLVARHISPQGHRHHHANFLKCFVINSRVKGSAKYRPKDIYYMGGDMVHMNPDGYEALDRILDWLLAEERREGDAFNESVNGHVVSFSMKF